MTTIVTWCVYNSSVISAYYSPRYYRTRGESGAAVHVAADINSVAGGSGNYIYDIVGNTYGLDIYSNGKLEGYINKAGTYNIKVRITDSDNAGVSTTVDCVINVAQELQYQDISGMWQEKYCQMHILYLRIGTNPQSIHITVILM